MFQGLVPARISRYEIKSLIGAGGMGTLYLARDTNPNTNRLVALKLLNAHLDSSDLRERFARESRALAALNHPNIVNIYDSGEFQDSPFIVMEYVRGETLAEKIKRRASMSLSQKLKLLVELCAGLGHAHEAGIIHRDIKPANLMVEQSGRLKILDFGIARVAEGSMTRAGVQVTQFNMRIGTPGYMSPEQIEGAEIDRRSDIFAVGAVAYELLSYYEAFSGANTRQIENKVLQAVPAPLVSLVPGIDQQIADIVARALEKDPDKRYQDAGALEAALEDQRWRLGPVEHTPPPKPTPPPSPAPGHRSRDSRADAVYQRSLAVYQEGAPEAARRFAIEALAEDPNHLGARALLDQLDPSGRISTFPGLSTPTPIPPTAVASGVAPTVVASGTLAPTVVDMYTEAAGSPGKRSLRRRDSRKWQRYQRPAVIATLLVTVAAVVMVVIGATSGFWSSSRSLTITRPTGGTILSGGITCGTLGSDCSTNHQDGDNVELQVQADRGFVFSGYTGDCAPGGRTTMRAPRTCGATFVPIPDAPSQNSRLLTITRPTGGTIVGLGVTCGTLGSECSTSHPEGTQIKLDFLADPGYVLARFTGACAPDGVTTMTEPRTCGAAFSPSQQVVQRPPPPPPLPITPREAGPAGGSGPSRSNPDIDLPPPPGPEASSSTPTEAKTVDLTGLGTAVPPPPISPEEQARKEIEKTLKEYCAAYSRLDAVEIRSLFPTVGSTLANQFQQFKAVECTLAGPPEIRTLDTVAGKARVEQGVTMIFDSKARGPEPPQNTTAVVTMSRQPAGRWYIETMVHRPKK